MVSDKLTHLDKKGNAAMVDVGDKPATHRTASATASITMNAEALKLLMQDNHKKGDVLTVAKIAGIQAAKQCHQLIPLCHPLLLTSIEIDFEIIEDERKVVITSTCKLDGKTGVEMEALTAASACALTIYDMCKAVDRSMVIGDISLLHKSGGASGSYEAGR